MFAYVGVEITQREPHASGVPHAEALLGTNVLNHVSTLTLDCGAGASLRSARGSTEGATSG